jgi:predicted metal-binding membrane protein
VEQEPFDRLDKAGRAAAGVATRPRIVAYAALTMAILLSWGWLAWISADAPWTGVDGGWLGRVAELCLSPASARGWPGFLALAAMWFLMALAMMLPSAAPLVRTYCDIAQAGALKGERVVHPLVLIAGYLTVWAAASTGFAALAMLVQEAAGMVAPVWIASACLALAGAYQFSGLKEACLRKCRDPFATLFARWSFRAPAIYRLGLEQGLWCFGCCWALMLVMFAVGTMNLLWMALLGLLTIVEKHEHSRAVSWGAGAILLVWAAMLPIISG